MKQRRGRLWLDAAMAGATAGTLALVMVYRLNPEIIQATTPILIGAVLWAAWGAVAFGLPLLVVAAIVRQILRPKGGWWVPELTAAAYLVASIMSKINGDLHEFLLSPLAQLVMRQDAVAWAAGALVALLGGVFVRRRGASVRLRYLFAVVLILLPLVRLFSVSTPPGFPLEVESRPIGVPERRLVVVGVEGLDAGILMGPASDSRFQRLLDLGRVGSWGPLTPHRPFLRRSAWTSVATGTYPDRHGLKSHWGWLLPWLPGETLRLLPWTPQGSRLILPWGMAQRVTPPTASIPPLWRRIRESGVSTAIFDWPGIWSPEIRFDPPATVDLSDMESDFQSSLGWALEPFGGRGGRVRRAIIKDLGKVTAAAHALRSGSDNVWLVLEGLAVARRELEPLKTRDVGEREVVELALQALDDHLRVLQQAAGSDATLALVSPYGFSPPDSWEKLRRLLGVGDDWRASAESCPEGLFLVSGFGVAKGTRFGAARLPDVAPTLAYLLGLPAAQYMQGGLIVEAVDSEFLASHPLRVVD